MDFEHFDKRKIPPNDLVLNIGRTPGRPFVIAATITETSLGDLLGAALFLATLKNQFEHAKLFVRYRDVRPYSREVFSLLPEIDQAVGVKGHIPVWARAGVPDSRLWSPWTRSIDSKTELHRSFCDFFVTDWMANPRYMHKFPNKACLRIPEDREAGLRQHLVEQGLDPDHWYVVIHYRSSDYLNKRSGQLRNSDPEAIKGLIDYIIDSLGGQVVQLGHPEMKPFPARNGFVDLSRIKDAFMLQAAAVAHARFMIAGPSGPVGFAWGFNVPSASVDNSDAHIGWGSSALTTITTHEVTTPDGQVLQNEALFKAGLLEYQTLRDKIRAGENYVVRKNSREELISVADHYFANTHDITGWRGPYEPERVPFPNVLLWPPHLTEPEQTFLDV